MHRALAGEADVEVADFDEVGHASFGHPVRENRSRAGTPRRSASSIGFIEGAADQLHADRQAAAGEAGGNRKRRQAEIIDRAGEARQPLDHGFGVEAVADIALGNGRRRHRRDRRDHRIGAGDRREVGGERRTAPAHRFEIGHGGNGEPVLQPHQDLRAVILRPLDHPALVEGGGFGREHELAGGGELALVRQFDLDDLGALFLEGGDGLVEHPRHLGIEIVDIEGGGHADLEALERACGRGHVVRHRQRRRRSDPRDRRPPSAPSSSAQSSTVCASGPTVSSDCDSGIAPARLIAADGGLQAGDAAEMRGHPDRAAGIGAQRRKGQPRRDRRARAGRRAAGDVIDVPGIAHRAVMRRCGRSARRRTPPSAASRAGSVPASFSRCSAVEVVVGDEIAADLRAAGHDLAGVVIHVLVRQRHAVQRARDCCPWRARHRRHPPRPAPRPLRSP